MMRGRVVLDLLVGGLVVVVDLVGDVDVVGKKFPTELGSGEGSGVLVEEIDLLQRETLGLERRRESSVSSH